MSPRYTRWWVISTALERTPVPTTSRSALFIKVDDRLLIVDRSVETGANIHVRPQNRYHPETSVGSNAERDQSKQGVTSLLFR